MEYSVFFDWSLLFLRIITGIIFFSSGLSHVSKPDERSRSIGMSKTFTLVLGIAEIAGSAGVILGIFIDFATQILIIVMLGAIWKKIFVWKTGFYSEKGYGWHYDLLLLCANLVIFFSDGGKIVLSNLFRANA